MRLIYVANIRFPTQKAHGVQIAENLTEFAKQGVEVTLLVPKRRNNLPTDKPFSYYGLPEQRVVRLWTLDFVDFLKPLGFYIQHISFSISTFLFLRKEKDQADMIIYGRDELVFALIKFFLPKRRVYYELHDWPERATFFWQYLFSRLDGIISTNNWKITQLINKYKIPASKILLARNAVDLKLFDIQTDRRELNLSENKILLGYVGQTKTMGVKKGVEEIVEATEEAKKEFPNIDLEIISNISHEDIPKYLKSLDILLMPFPYNMHYAHYMSPIKMFEYMAAGKAIIATDLPSIREVLDDQSAMFIKSSSENDILSAIRKLIKDATLRENLGKKARELAENYTLEKRVSSIINFVNTN